MLYIGNKLLLGPVHFVFESSDNYYWQQEGFEYLGVPLKINVRHPLEALSRHM